MVSFAATQSCIPSLRCVNSRSRSLTCIQMRIGFAGLFGISVRWYSQAPPGVSGLYGHCWLTNVPEYDSTRWYKSVRYHAMLSAAAAPELQPIVARESGLRVSFTPYCFSTSGNTSVSTNSAYLPDIVSYSRPRSLPCASPLPLAIDTATIAGTRFCAIRLSSAANSNGSGPSAPTMNGAIVPETYWLGTYTATCRV